MKSYVVPCPSTFRDRALSVSQHLGVSLSDLVIGALTLADGCIPDDFPDPGDALPQDRDEILLQSGPRAGRILKRKPRLQLRLPEGLEDRVIRRVLAFALDVKTGVRRLSLAQPPVPVAPPTFPGLQDALDDAFARIARLDGDLLRARDQAAELRAIISLLSFDILPNGVETAAQALYVLGLPPDARLSPTIVKTRFRLLSQIFHPDKSTGDNARMGMLIEANRLLQNRLAFSPIR